MNKAIIEINGKTIEKSFEPPILLSDLLEEMSPNHPCGGLGVCKKCRVKVSGALSARKDSEADLPNGVRLCCQTYATGDVAIQLENTSVWTKTNSRQTIMPNAPIGKNYGYVIDLGTTTVSVALFNQQTGHCCAETVFRNPQGYFGADVLSRMQKSINGQGKELGSIIQTAIHEACDRLLSSLSLRPDDVDAAVLVGNTAMLYLLTETDPTPLSSAPFHLSAQFGKFVAMDFLPMKSESSVFIPSCISPFLGADILSASIAGSFWDDGTHMIADLGTNGEILIKSPDGVFGCSCAVGPAFEGVGIECGMPGVDGAISSVKMLNGQFICEVIGNCVAQGICGSGLVDLIACLKKAGMVSSDGFLQCGDSFTIPGTDIYITQKDIRTFQLSKSAVCTGLTSLLNSANLKKADCLEIAGTFGANLSIRSAQEIRLIAKEITARIQSIGNAAATGAAMILLDRSWIDRTCELSQSIRQLSLTELPDFQNALIENLNF